MKRSGIYIISVVFVLTLFLGYHIWCCKVTTIILVRHAEKEVTPSNDPPLSVEGIERAKSLSHVVEDAGIDAIFATEYQRTQATVRPAADNLGLSIIIINSNNTEVLINTIYSEYKGKEILVAGHSNTVPGIMEALGIFNPPIITENAYDNLFIVHKYHFILRRTRVLHLKYGAPSQ